MSKSKKQENETRAPSAERAATSREAAQEAAGGAEPATPAETPSPGAGVRGGAEVAPPGPRRLSEEEAVARGGPTLSEWLAAGYKRADYFPESWLDGEPAGDPPVSEPAEKPFALIVTSIASHKVRCGRRFTRTPTPVRVSELSDADYDRLVSEPALVCARATELEVEVLEADMLERAEYGDDVAAWRMEAVRRRAEVAQLKGEVADLQSQLALHRAREHRDASGDTPSKQFGGF